MPKRNNKEFVTRYLIYTTLASKHKFITEMLIALFERDKIQATHLQRSSGRHLDIGEIQRK